MSRWFPWFLIATFLVLYGSVYRVLSKMTLPIAVLSPEGIKVQVIRFSRSTLLGPIRWREIAGVLVHKIWLAPRVTIVPRNLNALVLRLGKSQTKYVPSWSDRSFTPRALAILLGPTSILESHLPVSAEEFVADVEAYRNAYAAQEYEQAAQVGDSTVWPPPIGEDV
jgi:hypothetical protein